MRATALEPTTSLESVACNLSATSRTEDSPASSQASRSTQARPTRSSPCRHVEPGQILVEPKVGWFPLRLTRQAPLRGWASNNADAAVFAPSRAGASGKTAKPAPRAFRPWRRTSVEVLFRCWQPTRWRERSARQEANLQRRAARELRRQSASHDPDVLCLDVARNLRVYCEDFAPKTLASRCETAPKTGV
jgi:hypothetical protein